MTTWKGLVVIPMCFRSIQSSFSTLVIMPATGRVVIPMCFRSIQIVLCVIINLHGQDGRNPYVFQVNSKCRKCR